MKKYYPFKSRYGAKKAIIIGYLLSLICFNIGLRWYSEFIENGYINVSDKFKAFSYGDDAILQIYCIFIGGTIFLGYSIYLTFLYIVAAKRNDFQRINYFENAICPNCGNTSKIDDFPNLLCNKCGHKVENIKGFLDRNPDFSFSTFNSDSNNKEK